MAQIVQAAGFLLFSQAEPAGLLLMKHPTRWDLPKGQMQAGEQTLSTALRETEEETGIRPDQIEVDQDFNCVIEYDLSSKKRGDYRKRVTYFLGYVSQRHEPRTTEHIGFEWFDWPLSRSIQPQTIDPLLNALASHLARFPARVSSYSRT